MGPLPRSCHVSTVAQKGQSDCSVQLNPARCAYKTLLPCHLMEFYCTACLGTMLNSFSSGCIFDHNTLLRWGLCTQDWMDGRSRSQMDTEPNCLRCSKRERRHCCSSHFLHCEALGLFHGRMLCFSLHTQPWLSAYVKKDKQEVLQGKKKIFMCTFSTMWLPINKSIQMDFYGHSPVH